MNMNIWFLVCLCHGYVHSQSSEIQVSESTIKPIMLKICEHGQVGLFHHPQDCSMYVICNSTGQTISKCEDEYLYNPFTKDCSLPTSKWQCISGELSLIPKTSPTTSSPDLSSTMSDTTILEGNAEHITTTKQVQPVENKSEHATIELVPSVETSMDPYFTEEASQNPDDNNEENFSSHSMILNLTSLLTILAIVMTFLIIE